jgi:shikimate dehydrogenase
MTSGGVTSPFPFAGLLGADVRHSLSPRLHARWFREIGVDGSYVPLGVPDGAAALALVQALLPVDGFLGLNLTMPYKSLLTKAPEFAPSPRVQRIGFANTLHKGTDATWRLENTDVDGIVATLRSLCAPWLSNGSPWTVACMGAGGAAAGLVEAARHEPGVERIVFLCRDPRSAEKSLAGTIKGSPTSGFYPFADSAMALRGAERVLVVNTLPLGLPGSSTPENPHVRATLSSLARAGITTRYFDMLYLPSDGLSAAKALCVPSQGGTLMLQEQGRSAFALWTGVVPLAHPLVDVSSIPTL